MLLSKHLSVLTDKLLLTESRFNFPSDNQHRTTTKLIILELEELISSANKVKEAFKHSLDKIENNA